MVVISPEKRGMEKMGWGLKISPVAALFLNAELAFARGALRMPQAHFVRKAFIYFRHGSERPFHIASAETNL